MTDETKKMRDLDWIARLVLTSSEAEMLAGQLYDIQGYSELSDGLEEAEDAGHCHLSPSCTHLVDPLANLHGDSPRNSGTRRNAV